MCLRLVTGEHGRRPKGDEWPGEAIPVANRSSSYSKGGEDEIRGFRGWESEVEG